MPLDKITETIAHFIGLFEIATEEARARDVYHEFRAKLTGEDDQPIFHASTVTIRAPHDLDDYDPALKYDPQGFDVVHARSASFMTRTALEIGFPVWWHRPLFETDALHHPAAHLFRMREPHASIDPPGSVATVIHQHLQMSDDDHVSYGDHGLDFRPTADVGGALADLVDDALRLVPTADHDFPASPAEMKDLVLTLKAELDGFVPSEADGATVTVVKADTLSGIYVNGALVDEAPDYLAYRPAEETEDDGTDGGHVPVALVDLDGSGVPGLDAEPGSATGGGTHQPVAGVEITMGGNTLVNSVALTSNWLAATVTAVAGDYVELNAIVQANVFGDHDLFTDALGAAPGEAAGTIAFNIATFLRIDPQAGAGDHGGDAPHGPGDFPAFWAVTQVAGDLLIVNWIEQLSFMTDNDVAVLSATGGYARIGTGENGQFNDVSLAELGSYYDLIVIGGSVFDANFIWQMNVLLDDDLVGATPGFSGAGTASGGGNLLWNEAAITNVGAADRFSSLPDAFRDAIDGLAAGGAAGKAPADLLHYAGFQGLEALRVLYVTGDVINLQFIKQMNVLGDADQVALAMGQTQARPDAEWTVSTGANTLVNAASILDVDALGATHVGGGVYSDEILIQAELISPSALHTGSSADALVSEAVAFLVDDADAAGVHGVDAPIAAPMMNTAQADPMNVLHA